MEGNAWRNMFSRQLQVQRRLVTAAEMNNRTKDFKLYHRLIQPRMWRRERFEIFFDGGGQHGICLKGGRVESGFNLLNEVGGG